MNVETFRNSFIKAAKDKGLSEKVALQMYNGEVQKSADEPYTPEDYMQVKDLMSRKGYNPQYNIDDSHPYGRQYNQKIMQLRDKYHNASPEWEGVKGSVLPAAKGGVVGYGLGHVAGNMIKRFTTPNIAKHLPGWGRAIGLGVGALGGGASGYNHAATQTQAAQKLVNPQALRHTFDTLSKERQYGNNQIGNYRAL